MNSIHIVHVLPDMHIGLILFVSNESKSPYDTCFGSIRYVEKAEISTALIN